MHVDNAFLRLSPRRGTLRGHAMKLGVKAICIEIGNPNAFMEDLIRMCYLGIARYPK